MEACTGTTVTRRRILSVATAAGGMLVAACQPGAAPAATKEPVKLVYGTSLNQQQLQNNRAQLIDPFQAKYPHITLEIVPDGDAYTDKFKTSLAGGTGWDVVWESDNSIFLQGFIKDVSAQIKRDKFDTAVFPKQLFRLVNEHKGALNGLPNQSGGNWPVLPYNRTVIAKAGLPEPPTTWGDPTWTWQRFTEYCKKCTTVGEDGKPATFGIAPLGQGPIAGNLPYHFGAQWVSNDRLRTMNDSAEMIECYRTYFALPNEQASMLKPGAGMALFGTNNAAQLFTSGRLAFLQTSGGGLFAIIDAVKAGGDFAYAPLPRAKNASSFQWLDSNGVVSGTKHEDDAWQLVRWQASTPNWAVSRGTSPARADHMESWAKDVYGDLGRKMRLEVYTKSLENASGYDPAWLLPKFAFNGGDLVRTWINDTYDGKIAVPDGLRNLKPQLQSLIDSTDARYKG